MSDGVPSPERLAYLSLVQEVCDLYYREADLLDERRYEQWLELLADDIVYWMPMRKNVPWEDRDKDITAEDDVAWMHDDKPTLAKRVQQILTGIHWAEEPLSRVSHLVTNIRIADGVTSLAEGAMLAVTSRFFVYRNRLESETDLLVGRRHDGLRRAGGGLQIARRKIIIEQSVMMAKNLTVFL